MNYDVYLDSVPVYSSRYLSDAVAYVERHSAKLKGTKFRTENIIELSFENGYIVLCFIGE